jgi:hypothetical protein
MASAYLYYYNDYEDFSIILHFSLLCASTTFETLYLCLSEKQCKFYSANRLLPANIVLIPIVESSFKETILTTLEDLYQSGRITSNCPPVERHCINRWLYLKSMSFFGEDSLFCLDWDTLVFSSLKSYFTEVQGYDLAASNLFNTGWSTANIPFEPIWSLCPNMLFLSANALDLYIIFLKKYLHYCLESRSIVTGFFCDMQPWSSVISTVMAGKSKLHLLDLNSLVAKLPVVDHNVRGLTDCGLQFEDMRYYFQPGTQTYLNEKYLRAKHIVFSTTGHPFFVLKNSPSSGTQSPLPDLKSAGAIHFSGVEGKYLLLQTHIEKIQLYLRLHLDKGIPIP